MIKKSASKRSNFSYSIIIFLLFFCLLIRCSEDNAKNKFSNDPAVQQIKVLLAANDDEKALALIDETLLAKQKAQPKNTNLIFWLYETKADILASQYHFHDAISSLTTAKQLKPSQQADNLIKTWQHNIDRQQTERNKKLNYESGHNAGMSKKLLNNINIAYVYIDDNRTSKWSGKSRLKNQLSLENVYHWYQKQGRKYQINSLNFNTRYFVLSSPKGISKEWLRGPEAFPYIAETLIRKLGYNDLASFIQAINGNDPNSQTALVFHSNFTGRSFARICRDNDEARGCYYEYVMLTEQLTDNHHGWALPQVQAHEMLHLFGADDLYDIKNAKDYAVTDIMNYYSSHLTYSTISPLTAWAIGWQSKPYPPFVIAR